MVDSKDSSIDLWIILGDFNVIFGAHAKMGSASSGTSYHEFNEAIDVMDIVNVDTLGSFFTWAHRGLQIFVEFHLDRVFCTQDSLGFERKISCHAFAHHQWDHNPICLKVFNVSATSPRLYIFQSIRMNR